MEQQNDQANSGSHGSVNNSNGDTNDLLEKENNKINYLCINDNGNRE